MGLTIRFLLLAILLPSCSLFRYTVPSSFAGRSTQATVPEPWTRAHELSVVTMNVKDMLWLSDDRRLRMDRIAELLVELSPDVVCLQEGFVAGDISLIREPLRDIGLSFAMDYPSGVVGSGLWIMSRFPIHGTAFKRFSKNGVFHDTRGGDWWAGKGVALARLELSEDKFLDIYNTHMICNLGPQELRAHRMDQAREFARFVAGSTPDSIPAILMGDFNCGPGSTEFNLIEETLAWEPLLEQSSRFDHIQGMGRSAGYTFERLGEQVIQGSVSTGDGEVWISDHDGHLLCLRIAPEE